jgi:putative nucleotidyltransferase with HDIG domain
VLLLSETLDIRQGTAEHSRSVGRYAELTARQLGLPEESVRGIQLAGSLHDIGKIGVADAILAKPGPLSEIERVEIRRHPQIGAQVLRNARLYDIAESVGAHHERPDGTGYPRGAAGSQIPLEAKIIADAYEAMTADRVYRRCLPEPAARTELRVHAGSQFDERAVDALLTALDADLVSARHLSKPGAGASRGS